MPELTVPPPPTEQILFPLVHTLCPLSASMTPVTSNAPASVDVDTFVTFNWVIVVDPADRVVPTDVDPVMEADPAMEILSVIYNERLARTPPLNVEVPAVLVALKMGAVTVPVKRPAPVTESGVPGVVVPMPRFPWDESTDVKTPEVL